MLLILWIDYREITVLNYVPIILHPIKYSKFSIQYNCDMQSMQLNLIVYKIYRSQYCFQLHGQLNLRDFTASENTYHSFKMECAMNF